MGRRLGKRVTTSQIRAPFGEVKRMREFDKYKLDILRAKLAYTSGRHKEIADLQDTLDEAIKKVNEQNFVYFKDFFEAIVAYHRKHGKE
jgi:CRISPR-associated protein Csm2